MTLRQVLKFLAPSLLNFECWHISSNQMATPTSLILNTLAIGLIFTIPGVLFERWLVTNGVVRDRTRDMIIVVFSIVFIRQMWYPSLSWWYFALFLLLGMTLGVNRADLWTTMRRGRWWWKSEQ